MAIPTEAEIEGKLRGEDLNAWLNLWRAEQGPAKPGALKLIAEVIPFPIDQSLKVLDIGCGPGDAGRAIHSRFPQAQIDFVDRNEFFVALCGAVNRRDGVGGRTWACDLSKPDGRQELMNGYDVVVAVNAVHWFSLATAEELFGDLFESLRSGGVFLLMEPACVEPPFASGFEAWQKEQPSQHQYENWRRFWSRVNDLVGYDYGFLGDPDEQNRIGEELSVTRWVDLLADAGFKPIDILLRDTEKSGAGKRQALKRRAYAGVQLVRSRKVGGS
jgi:trans-aconitate methyltransferase